MEARDFSRVRLHKQFRYPVRRIVTELPTGKLNGNSENILEAAKREFKEETGYSAGCWELLGSFMPAAGYSNEIIYIYLAKELEKCDRNLDVEFMPLDTLKKMVLNGDIIDGKTQAALMFYLNSN